MSKPQKPRRSASPSHRSGKRAPRTAKTAVKPVLIRRVASSLLFQSTALAGTFAGIPVPIYARAYAQSVSCTPSPLTTETASNIDSKQFYSRNTSLSSQTISCTISSGTLTTPQYAYGGPYIALLNVGAGGDDTYRGKTYNVHSNWAWDGLGVKITNNATITVTQAADTKLLLQPGTDSSGNRIPYSDMRISGKQHVALSGISLGALNWSGSRDNIETGAGSGGDVTIVSTGDVSSSVGGGILALSKGGTNKHAHDKGNYLAGWAGKVTVTSKGAVSGTTFGIAALSIGGPSTYSSDDDYSYGGISEQVYVYAYQSVSATSSGPAIAAVSYGGNTPYNINQFGDHVGYGPTAGINPGASAGDETGGVKVVVGSTDSPMTGSITTESAGAVTAYVNNNTWQLTRNTGAGIFAIARSGDGIPGGGKRAFGAGYSARVQVTVTGSDTTKITTKGTHSPGIFAVSQGGTAYQSGKDDHEQQGGRGYLAYVTLTGGGAISTAGDYSTGIVAQSLGGGGSSNYKDTNNWGGKAGKVTVTNDFSITTQGTHSHGILAQSASAADGDGIYTYAGKGQVTWGDTSSNGSTSDTVTVSNTGDITVYGADSHGIVAQSIGGGGGTLRSTATLSTTSYGSVDVLPYSDSTSGAYQTIGGQSQGSVPGSVYVTNHGTIATYGGYAKGSSTSGTNGSASDTVSLGGGIAILAQSIGGGGGINSGSGANGAIGAGDGSSDGSGSNGGTVEVHNYGNLTTTGSEAHGIVAQSIGGGGGQGRNKKGLFHSVGGQGGPGGTGGKVFVEQNAGAITVGGDYAMGIIAQSVGGGGGVGGQATAWGLFVSSATGGQGGAGGDGGHAQVTQLAKNSTITTSGDHGTGVLVQSIGGGGGVGGNAKSKSAGLGVDVAISHGGSGANGGDGGGATVFLNGAVTTKGTDAQALVVQSIGGGGGNGGQATSKATAAGVPVDEDDDTVSVTVSIAHGGSGGAGGNGGEAFAKLYDTASITTYKDGAGAIVAQSIGGGGGNGGDSTASSAAKTLNSLFEGSDDDGGEGPKNFSLNVDVSLGGTGGAAGYGGLVKVYNDGKIITHGSYADGILAQSIGGGGGNAGTGSGSTKDADAIKSAGVNVVIGGDGGGGGNGGNINVGLNTSSAAIKTYGHVSRGIVAHSIGGGGGNSSGAGGMGDADWTIGLTVGIVADGTAGGDGGDVKVWNQGTITTSGDWSDGILAQSIGGGGGAAGSGKSSLSIKDDEDDDDDGGGGDDTEATEATSASAVALASSDEDDGGDSDGGDDGDDSDNELNLGLTVGMTGGYGGHGGTVTIGVQPVTKNGTTTDTVVGTGTIKTSGTLSSGIVAQSIGGGGGAAAVSSGSNDSDDSSSSSSSSSSDSDSSSGCEDSGGSSSSSSSDSSSDDDKDSCVTLAIGASGGTGGHGGQVTVQAGSVYTQGFSSHGIVAQSIGGGGGVGISSGLAVDKVHLKLGGGGDGGGGYGGAVTVTTLAGTTVQTQAEASHGIVAQSIGAGGGLGLVALGTLNTVNDDTLSDILSVTLGSTSDQSSLTALDGGVVTIQHYGTLSTGGERAVGIVAQSIGGGGGFVTASEAVLSSVAFEKDQSRGAGYDVYVTLHNGSSIVTTGDGGIGILAQSIGGGGGVAADLNAQLNTYYVAYGQGTYKASDYSGDGRHSSAVTVSVHSGASIKTSGNYAHGIIAQSVAGGGGIFEKNGKTYAGSLHRNGVNSEASVSVTVDGSVSVAQDNAWGVWAQTQDTSVTLTIGSSGSVSGTTSSDGNGGAAYAAVDSNGTATLNNSGTITGNVIVSKGGKTSWSKDYTSTTPAAADGAVQLSVAPLTGTSLFLNQGRGTFVTGAIADLDTVLNAGTINVGGADTFLQTVVTGDLVGVGTSERGSRYDAGDLGLDEIFTEVSYYAGRTKQIWRDATTSRGGLLKGIDVDMAAGTSDQLVVRGDFAGSWGAILNPDTLLPNTRVDLLKVQGVDTSDLTVLPTLVFSFTKPTTSSAGWKGFQVDRANFSSTGVAMGRNAAEVSRGLQSAWDKLADGSAQTVSFGRDRISIAETFAAFHAATPEIFEDMLTPIASQTANAPLAGAPQSAIAAANSVLSCPAFTTGVTLQEGECVWGRFLGSRAEQDPMDGASGFKESTTGIQTGGQKMLGNGWFLGGSLIYEESWYKNDAATEKLDTQSFTGAIALKKEIGPWLFALAGGAGYNWGDSRRYMTIGTLSAVAEAEPKSGFVFGRARASYEFAFDDRIYMRPMVDFDVMTVRQQGYTETGAGGLNLIVDETTETVFGVTPGVEVGARFNLSEDMPARLFAGVGVSFLSNDEWETTARFAGLTAMDSFSTYMPINDTIGRVTAGIDLQKTVGMELKLQYDGAFANGYQSHGGSLRVGYRF